MFLSALAPGLYAMGSSRDRRRPKNEFRDLMPSVLMKLWRDYRLTNIWLKGLGVSTFNWSLKCDVDTVLPDLILQNAADLKNHTTLDPGC